eukprot:scaffold46157_cov21-Tisochrysis_lutea.AAC.2
MDSGPSSRPKEAAVGSAPVAAVAAPPAVLACEQEGVVRGGGVAAHTTRGDDWGGGRLVWEREQPRTTRTGVKMGAARSAWSQQLLQHAAAEPQRR